MATFRPNEGKFENGKSEFETYGKYNGDMNGERMGKNDEVKEKTTERVEMKGGERQNDVRITGQGYCFLGVWSARHGLSHPRVTV